MWIELREIIHLGLKTPTQVQVISISNRRKKKQLRPFVKIISRTKSVTRPYFTELCMHDARSFHAERLWFGLANFHHMPLWIRYLPSTWQKIHWKNKWGVNKISTTQMPYRITQKVRHLCHDRSLKLPYFTRLRNGGSSRDMSPPPQKKKISFRVSIKPKSHENESLN